MEIMKQVTQNASPQDVLSLQLQGRWIFDFFFKQTGSYPLKDTTVDTKQLSFDLRKYCLHRYS